MFVGKKRENPKPKKKNDPFLAQSTFLAGTIIEVEIFCVCVCVCVCESEVAPVVNC